MKLRTLGIIVVAALTAAACDDPLDPTPQQQIPQAEALDSPDEIRVAVNGMYDALQTCDGGYCRNLVVFPDLYAGNLRFTGTYTSDREVANRNLTAGNTALPGIWGAAYQGIDRANNVLQGLTAQQAKFVDKDEFNQLKGEAHFIRALNYFTLIKFFGGVPLVTEPIVTVPAEVGRARSSEAEIWAFIEAELAQAMNLLPEDAGAVRASMGAATALKARAHLYQREWQAAFDLADEVIKSGMYELELQYANVFEKEQTNEAIFEIPFTVTDAGSLAFWFFPSGLGGRRGFAPAAGLVNSFEDEDVRFSTAYNETGGGTSYGFKYTDIASTADDVPVIRLAEMYLIRAEAAARLGNLGRALADVNVIRARAELGEAAADANKDGATSMNEVLAVVLTERRHELFYEGHWFFDLKRFGDVPAGSTLLTALGLTGNRLLFPIPQREIDANGSLIQNPGY